MKIIENNSVVDIKTIARNDFNPKADIKTSTNALDLEQFERLKRSLEAGGQTSPLIVREVGENQYELVDGEHRLAAMLDLGFTKAEIKNLGKLSRQEAIAVLLNHEVTFDADPVKEAKLLQEYVAAGWDLKMLAYSEQDVFRKIEILDYSIEQAMGKLPVIELEEGAEDEKLEAAKTYYVSCNKKNYDWLIKHYKSSRGQYALNGNTIVEILSGKREAKKT